MATISSARFLANFFTVLRRFRSRLTTAVFAIAPSVPEWEFERSEQRFRLGVGFRRRRDRDVHAPDRVNLVVLDLGKDYLLLDAHVEIAPAVEGTARYATKVAHARQRNRHQPVQELVHAFLAQRDHATDRIAGANLPYGDRFLRLGDHRLLTRELLHVTDRVLENLLARAGLADSHVENDFLQARHLHLGLVSELLGQRRHDFLLVDFLQTRHRHAPSTS